MACTSWPRRTKTSSQRRVCSPSKSPRTAMRRGGPGSWFTGGARTRRGRRGGAAGGGAGGAGGGGGARAGGPPRRQRAQGVDVKSGVGRSRQKGVGDGATGEGAGSHHPQRQAPRIAAG